MAGLRHIDSADRPFGPESDDIQPRRYFPMPVRPYQPGNEIHPLPWNGGYRPWETWNESVDAPYAITVHKEG